MRSCLARRAACPPARRRIGSRAPRAHGGSRSSLTRCRTLSDVPCSAPCDATHHAPWPCLAPCECAPCWQGLACHGKVSRDACTRSSRSLPTRPLSCNVQVSLEASTCTNHLLDPAFGGVYASEEQVLRTRIPSPKELPPHASRLQPHPDCNSMHLGCNPCIQAAAPRTGCNPVHPRL